MDADLRTRIVTELRPFGRVRWHGSSKTAPSIKAGPNGAIVFRVWGNYLISVHPEHPLAPEEAEAFATARKPHDAGSGVTYQAGPNGGWPFQE